MTLTVDGVPAQPVKGAALSRKTCPHCNRQTSLALWQGNGATTKKRFFLLCLGVGQLEATCWELHEIPEPEGMKLIEAGQASQSEVCPICQRMVAPVLTWEGEVRQECSGCKLDVTAQTP
jgi:hypothetical protein